MTTETAPRNNLITLTYNVQNVTKKKEYKEMRDRVKAATGLSNKEVASIFTPAYGEFYNWLQIREKALQSYEDVVVEQVLAMLNKKRSPYSDLVSAANTMAGTANKGSKEEDTEEAKDQGIMVIATLERYKKDHDLSSNALAKMLGVSDTTVHNWLHNKTAPSEDNINKLASWLQGQGYPVPGIS